VKLKLDENLGERGRMMLRRRRSRRFHRDVAQMESEPDKAVIETCRREGRALVTLDLDFANTLDYRPSEYAGIAVLRCPQKPRRKICAKLSKRLAKGLEQNPLAGKLWIVEKGRIRLYQQNDEP